jgi:hypothetical protein
MTDGKAVSGDWDVLADECVGDVGVFQVTDNERSVFKQVDRAKEDLMVRKFKDTRDMSLMGELFQMREPTLWVWAKKFAWLDSEDDMFSEFKVVWSNCLQQYEYEARVRPVKTRSGGLVFDKQGKPVTRLKRTAFNTYLFTSIRNRAWNIIKKRNAKKMLDKNGKSILDSMMSFDYDFGDGQGDPLTLHDTVKDQKAPNADSTVQVEDIIRDVSQGDEDIAEILRKFVSCSYLKKLSTACCLKAGTLQISKHDLGILLGGGDAAVEHLKRLISSTGSYPSRFKVLNYAVYPGRVQFEVLVKNEKILRKLKNAVEACVERNKNSESGKKVYNVSRSVEGKKEIETTRRQHARRTEGLVEAACGGGQGRNSRKPAKKDVQQHP